MCRTSVMVVACDLTLPPPVLVLAQGKEPARRLLRRPSGSTRSSRIYSTHTRQWPRSPAACDPRPTGSMISSVVLRNVMLDGSSTATKRHFRQRLLETGGGGWDGRI